MSNFVYRRIETTSMKLSGILDAENMTIDVDGDDKSIATLLSDFNGAEIEINVKYTAKEDLDEPTDDDKDSDELYDE